MTCVHERGEYSDDYQHCLDCGMEWVRIGASWFVVEAWVRISAEMLTEAEA